MVMNGQVYRSPNFVKERRVVALRVDEESEDALVVLVSLKKKPKSSTDLLAKDGKVYQCWNMRVVPLAGFAAMELVGEVDTDTQAAILYGVRKALLGDDKHPEKYQFGPPILDPVKDRDRVEHQTMETNVMNAISRNMGGETD